MSAKHCSSIFACLCCLLFISLGTMAEKLPLKNSEHQQRNARLQSYLGTHRTYPSPRAIPTEPAGCQLLHINHLGRHGSRHPIELDDVLALVSEYETLVGTRPLTKAGSQLRVDIHRMADWLRNNPARIAQLTDKGVNEELALGQRAARMLRPETRNSQQLSIATGTSQTDRTKHSLEMFQEGLSRELGENMHVIIRPVMPDKKMTELLTPFFHCPRLDRVLKPLAKSATAEYIANLSQSHPEITTRFADQLIPGLSDAKAIRLAINLFQLCRIENPLDQSFGICATFTDSTADDSWLGLVQWLGDTANHIYYYNMGPAIVMDDIQSSMGMPILRHFLDTTDAAARDESDVRAHFRFAHDATLSPLLQSIGIIKTRGAEDERYLSWNTSRQLPMGANLYWQLYECRDGLKVRMLLNERVEPFPFPPCSKQELCDWRDVKQHYKHADYQDRMEKACSVDEHNVQPLSSSMQDMEPSASDNII